MKAQLYSMGNAVFQQAEEQHEQILCSYTGIGLIHSSVRFPIHNWYFYFVGFLHELHLSSEIIH